MLDTKPFPTLDAFIRDGLVTVLPDGAIVAVAADGTEVQVGDTDHLADTERYLQDHPTPYSW